MQAIDANRAPARHRLTVDEYQRMGEAGVFAPNARVELIDGEVIDMAPDRQPACDCGSAADRGA